MKTPNWRWIVGGVLVLALIYPLTRIAGSAGEVEEEAPSKSGRASDSSSLPGNTPGESGGTTKSGRGPGPIDEVPEIGEAESTDLGPPVHVNPAKELAKVNGVGITLKDLMPLQPDQTGEQVMTLERYRFLLNRAVERELTFQTSKKVGVKLTTTQEESLAEVVTRRKAVSEREDLVDDLGDSVVNAEFHQRDVEAQMLQSTLAEHSGVPSPNVGTQRVKEYYEQHRAELGNLPDDPQARQAAWGRMESQIRARLAPIVRREYQEQFASYIKALKEGANITVAPQ